MRYAIVIEKAPSNYAAYVPDLPGCVATGASVSETESLIPGTIELHLEGPKADGLSIPPSSTTSNTSTFPPELHLRIAVTLRNVKETPLAVDIAPVTYLHKRDHTGVIVNGIHHAIVSLADTKLIMPGELFTARRAGVRS